jgi:O-antigen/teichoic acid export membrane protein
MDSDAPAHSARRIVLRNTVFLVVAKVVATPITILVNAITARYIGPEAYSHLYLASTYVGFGVLLVDFGQSGAIPGMIARDRSRAGEFLGSALAWRFSSALVVYGLIGFGCHLLGYDLEFERVYLLVISAATIQAVTGAMLDTIRGFERTDVDAMLGMGLPLLGAVVSIPILVLGGRLKAVLVGDILVAGVALLFVRRALRQLSLGRPKFRKDVIKTLLLHGYPFLFFGLAMTLQPSIDAFFLSRYSPSEVVGWHGASRKLVGLLVFPASALIAALYPVLCRLWATDQDAYTRTSASSLRSSIIFVVPAALGCALFPEIGVTIFGKDKFGPAVDNLRVLAIFVGLVYFSMPLGSSLLAAGKARAWSVVQLLCVVLSLILDPLLVPWFQTRTGNGGIGICVANVISEVFMVGIGLWMMPRRVVDRSVLRALLMAAVCGAAMAGTARLLSNFVSFWIAAPCSLLAYAAAGVATGVLSPAQLQTVRDIVARKVR